MTDRRSGESMSHGPNSDGTASKGNAAGTGVNVHATAALEENDLVQMEERPFVTCFGLRRKQKSAMQKPRSSSFQQQEGSNNLDHNAKQLTASKPSSTCGAGELLQSLVPDSRAKQGKDQGHYADSGKLSGATAEASAVTPRIMASYESISIASPATTQPDTASPIQPRIRSQVSAESVQDRDREDVADSVVEDEEYDAFGSPQWTVDPHDIFFISRGDGSQKVCRLGKGAYGPVYLGVWKDQDVAVKLARQAPISLKNERHFQANIALLHSLNHPNVVAFLGACCWKGGKRSVLVTEFMDKSDLRMLLSRPELAPKFAWREHGQTVALDIASGLGYLHNQGLVHGRLKSTNVLMNRAGVAKLSDMALPKLLSHCKSTPATPSFPESLGDYETMPGDIFALGLILHELLTQERPSEGGLRPIRTPFEAPAKIAYLVECCLDADPNQRPTIDHVITIIGGKR